MVALAAVAVCVQPTLAHGQQVFTDEAAFLAAVRNVTVESFESVPTDPQSCTTGGTAVDVGTISIITEPADGGTSFLCIGSTGDGGPRPTDGANALIAGSNTGDRWTLTLSIRGKAAHAVGFYLTDAAEQGDALFSTDKGHQAVMAECCQPSEPTSEPIFFGFVSDKPFKTFYLTNTGHVDGWGIDELILAAGKSSGR
jgi:hypothetical protein